MTDEVTQAAASVEDAQEAIDALNDADLIRLRKIAKNYNYATGIDTDDLVQKALVSIYAGERRWTGGTEFVSFVAGALKSIAYNQRTSAHQKHISQDSDDRFLTDLPSHSPALKRY